MQIKNWQDYRRFLTEDMRAYNPELRRWRFWHSVKYPTLAWQRKLRLAEYLINRRTDKISRLVALFFRFRARNAGIKLGFSIPPNVFGPGLNIAHWGTIVVNDKAVVGRNCRIHPGTVIGEKAGRAARIGDNCYLGPGSKLIGGVELGDRVTVGANAVVTKSFSSDSVLAGVPAIDISKRT